MEDINKDTENLEEIINLINKELDKKDKNVSAILDLKDLLSLRNLIKAYKELKESNEILNKAYWNYCIPVSLVEKEIEKLNKQLEEDLQDERKVNSNRFIIICQCKNCLQELLEKRK